METGTVDAIAQSREIKRRLSNISAGSSGNGGHGDGNNGGGNDDSGGRDAGISVPTKARVFTIFLLVVVLMTFGGLCAAYIVTATNKAIEWRPFDLPVQVWISTIIILASSIIYHRANVAIDKFDQLRAKKWLVATAVFGAAFISSQLLAWIELSQQGLYFSGNPYAGFFYILTAVHALHVLGGVIALGSIVLYTWNPLFAEKTWERVQTLAQAVGWYWHFMGGVWVVLFVLLGFWK